MMHSCHQAKTTAGVQRKVITIILLRIITFLVYLNDCLYLLDYLFKAAGRTDVSQIQKQMERLVNIS